MPATWGKGRNKAKAAMLTLRSFAPKMVVGQPTDLSAATKEPSMNLLTLVLAALPAVASAAKDSPKPPNVILCMTDDQGWGDVGYNGNPVLKTPTSMRCPGAVSALTVFMRAHCVCSPTRGSCMTGRHPNRYRCFSWGYDLPLRETTIAEAVKTAGYATGHFGKWHLGGIPFAEGNTGRGVPESLDPRPRHPGNQGFDEWLLGWQLV